MSMKNDGFLSYTEMLAFERRARELRAEAIRHGFAGLFGRNKAEAVSRSK